jgi:cardiolipin synthase (CMP-forming)
MKWRDIPNVITVFRLVLIIPFLYTLLNDHYRHAFYLYLLAGFSDNLDGFLARYFNWTSEFGAFLDPIADKLLIMTSFLALAWMGEVPVWIASLVIMRDICILSGVGSLRWLVGPVEIHPSFVSKVNTALQILLVLLILYQLSYRALPSEVITVIMLTMVVTTVWSLLDYFSIWVRRMLQGYRS